MKRQDFLIMLLVVGWLLAVSQTGAFGSPPSNQTCGAVQPDVLEALETDSEVSVFMSLQVPPDWSQLNIGEVQVNTAARQAAVLADLTASDFTLTTQYEAVPALAGLLRGSGLSVLNCHKDVLAVERNRELFAALPESVPLIRADHVHTEGLDGTDVDVAVLDTGIDTDHDDLVDNIIGEECTTDVPTEEGISVVCPDDPSHPNYSPGHPAEDGNGHGTHVSGIITAGSTQGSVTGLVGVAPNTDIFAYKVLTDAGHGFMEWFGAALDDIFIYHGTEFEFINMSLEDQESHQPEECGTDPTDVAPAITNTIFHLRARGTLTFAAAGNFGFKSGLAWPACIPDVVAVGSVYDADLGTFPWDNVPCTDPTTAADRVPCSSQSHDDLDLLAPGCRILSTWPFPPYGVAFMCGTSMASPHAVGVAALLLDAEPGLTPDEIVARLKLGPFVTDYFDPNNIRTTPRVDARIVLLPTHGEEDYDQDGCSNQEELGPNQMFGGLRRPLNFWDFYDTPDQNNVRDKLVDMVNDLFRVAGRFDANDDGGSAPINRYTDPLSHPPAAPAYHPAFDRGPPVGPNAWNLPPADGIIDLMNDILGVAAQFDHDCRPPP